MGGPVGHEGTKQTASKATDEDTGIEGGGASNEHSSREKFSSEGPKPAVSTEGHARKPSASELAYGGKRQPPSAQDWSAAAGALQAAADIMSNRRSQEIKSVHSSYALALWKLYASVSGIKDGTALSAADRNTMFGEARHELKPAIDLYASSEDGRAWLADYFYPEFNANISSFAFSEAKERVHHAVLIDPEHIVEIPPDSQPREQGRVLHQELAKLIPTMRGFNEQLIRLNEHAIEHESKAMFEAGTHGSKTGSLAELANVLMLADGWLTLTDEEFNKHLNEIHGVFNGVSSYAELVKVVTELTGGAIGVAATAAATIARAGGNVAYASVASGIARKVGLVFADVVASIEMVHGFFVILDAHATRQEKIDGAVDVASGGAWFTGRYLGGAAVGAAASTAILLGYAELKWALTTYWGASLGINTMFLSHAYDTLAMDGDAIARSADQLAKAQLLQQQEKDPEKQATLRRVEVALAHDLGNAVDSLISDCGPADQEAGVSRMPGAYPILKELFSPLKAHRGAKTPQAAAAAGALALEKIIWARVHAADILLESNRNHDLSAVQADAAKREKKSNKSDE